jgi:hypothetical protein
VKVEPGEGREICREGGGRKRSWEAKKKREKVGERETEVFFFDNRVRGVIVKNTPKPIDG